jgi:hypothetical protein
VPQEYHLASVLVYLFKEALALKIGLVLVEIHIVAIAQCAVHDCQRM